LERAALQEWETPQAITSCLLLQLAWDLEQVGPGIQATPGIRRVEEGQIVRKEGQGSWGSQCVLDAFHFSQRKRQKQRCGGGVNKKEPKAENEASPVKGFLWSLN
jgi:hypothetical protein